MSPSKLKGSLLEYIVRRLLLNCGFTTVRPDGLLIFRRSGLTMLNGKGAAHDADVLVDPPVQMPFSYPFRLNFECKAYNKKTDLSVIRNGLGLRYDINEFEIVTRDQLAKRQNNRRSSLAIDNRQRFNYQVGVASVEDFSKPAFEFAANNKIPLLSLRWFLPSHICDKFHEINSTYIRGFHSDQINGLMEFLKGKNDRVGQDFLENTESIFKEIYDEFLEFENQVLVGLLESGDLVFLIDHRNNAIDYLSGDRYSFLAQFHYERRGRGYWRLNVDNQVEFGFYLPENVIAMWRSQNFDRQAALDIKAQMFSKIFVFNRSGDIPFRLIKIDRESLNGMFEQA